MAKISPKMSLSQEAAEQGKDLDFEQIKSLEAGDEIDIYEPLHASVQVTLRTGAVTVCSNIPSQTYLQLLVPGTTSPGS